MSSSPAPSDADQAAQEQITFRFCRDCSNMLFPIEDRAARQLMFRCRTCPYVEPAKTSCVYRNHLHNTVGETAGVTQDVGSDPTVGPDSDVESDFSICTLCGEEVICSVCAVERWKGYTATSFDDGSEMAAEEDDATEEDDKMPEALPRSNKRCPNCHETEAVFFQSQQRTSETGMKLFYVCCSCGKIFQ